MITPEASIIPLSDMTACLKMLDMDMSVIVS